MAERKFFVRRFCGPLQAIKEQYLVTGIDYRMHALRQHGRAAGDKGGDKLHDGDQAIADEGGIDD